METYILYVALAFCLIQLAVSIVAYFTPSKEIGHKSSTIEKVGYWADMTGIALNRILAKRQALKRASAPKSKPKGKKKANVGKK